MGWQAGGEVYILYSILISDGSRQLYLSAEDEEDGAKNSQDWGPGVIHRRESKA